MKKAAKILGVIILLFALGAGVVYYNCNRVVIRPMTSGDTYSEMVARLEEASAQIKEIYGSYDTVENIAPQYYNTTPSDIQSVEDVIELAKRECFVEYNTIEYAYEEETDIWHIRFSYKSRNPFVIILGGEESVYISGDGVTLRVIAFK